mmetsp:Transcript_6415/g.18917  ORF Transcript_6415/g.18917 Transcript_6415/m.18917 type:complete len:333 (+) Transcript_6415:130-1128(+)
MTVITIVQDINRNSIVIQTHTTGLQNRRALHGGMNGRQGSIIKVGWRFLSVIDFTTRIDEFFERSDAVTALSGEHAIGGGVLHEQRIDGSESCGIRGDGASAMRLVDGDFSSGAHVKEALLGVDVRFRCDPRGGVNGASQRLVIQILPLDGEGDGVFGRHALGVGNARGTGRCDAHGTSDASQRPLTPIDVMTVQVIRDIGRLARPRLEGFQLMLGLGHVGVHVLEVAEFRGIASTISCVGIKRIQSFVNFDGDQHILGLGGSGQFVMMFQCLDDRLRDHDMHASIDALQGDVKVRVVRCEDDGHIACLERLAGGNVGLGIDLIVVGECLAC